MNNNQVIRKVSTISNGTRVATPMSTSIGTIMERVAPNTYKVKMDDGREFTLGRHVLSRWDEKARRSFKF